MLYRRCFWNECSGAPLSQGSCLSLKARHSLGTLQTVTCAVMRSCVLTASSLEGGMWGEPVLKAAWATFYTRSGQGVTWTLHQLRKMQLVSVFPQCPVSQQCECMSSVALRRQIPQDNRGWSWPLWPWIQTPGKSRACSAVLQFSAVSIQAAAPVPNWILDLILSFPRGLSRSKSSRLAGRKGASALGWFSVNAVY